ncbi:Uncharacterised protein [Klebsiella pneumoniae]|nr:Uncharacterised protein [Klebsiella pneumoniae]
MLWLIEFSFLRLTSEHRFSLMFFNCSKSHIKKLKRT